MEYSPDKRLPDLYGRICTALKAEQSWFCGHLQHPYNAFYLQVDNRHWHRFSVHCRGVYWKAVDRPQHPRDGMTDAGWEFPLAPLEDYNITGRQIARIEAFENFIDPQAKKGERICEEAGLRIQFIGGGSLEFRYEGYDLEIRLREED